MCYFYWSLVTELPQKTICSLSLASDESELLINWHWRCSPLIIKTTYSLKDMIEEVCVSGNLSELGTYFSNQLALLRHILSTINFEQQDLHQFDERISRFREEANRLRQKLINDEKQVDLLISRLYEVRCEIKQLQSAIGLSRSAVNSLLKQLSAVKPDELSNDTLFSSEYANSTVQQMQQLCNQYEHSFGMKIQRTHSNLIQLLFYGCARQPESHNGGDPVCCCQLRMISSNHFEVVRCNPPIADLSRLVNHLNWTEDMRSFVIVLRQRFCHYFQLTEK